MATKRKPSPEDVELVETGAVVMAPEASDETPFVLGEWNGLPQWRCRFCAWDTLAGEDEALDHYIHRHAGRGV